MFNTKMKRFFFVAVAILVVQNLSAQIGHGGVPYAFDNILDTPPEIVMPAVDVESYMLEDMQLTDVKRPFRFGVEIDTAISLSNCGQWYNLPNGDRVWQLRITCKGAKTLNFVFDRFVMPRGGRMFIYTPDKQYVTGAFTESNNNPEKVFSTGLYPGGSVIFEVYEPLAVRGATELLISTVVHGYRDILFKTDKGEYGSSGSCNININCSAGNDWQLEKRGVALIINRGNAHCTGALINNTSNDGTPYVLTANHCIEGRSPSSFVFVFKHEAANCTGTTGPTIYTINYATLIANGANSDFALLRLNDTVPRSYDPFYLGWSRSATAPTAMTCIHHPSGDLKKISQAGAGVSSSYNTTSFDDGTHWRVSRWLQGTTEGGSSGSPLFNQNHQIIGQLHGGDASCSNISGSDYYGKFAYSWTNNNASSSSARLKDWLDPTNTGAVTCPSYDPCTSSLQTDAVLSNAGTDSVYCNISSITPEVRVTNRGNDTLTSLVIKCQIDNQQPQYFSWNGSLVLNASDVVVLNAIAVDSGNHVLTIWCENPNGIVDQNISNDTVILPIKVNRGTEVTYRIHVDDRYASNIDWFGPYISWEFIRDDGTVMAQYNELTSIDFRESFCTQVGCYTLRLMLSSYISRLRSDITIECYVDGRRVRTVTGSDSVSFCTSDEDLDNLSSYNSFNIYPNPANVGRQIVVEFANTAERLYFVVNAKGEVCAKGVFTAERNIIHLPQMAQGIYFMKVVDDSGNMVEKLIMK